jgi:hypothetical protein
VRRAKSGDSSPVSNCVVTVTSRRDSEDVMVGEECVVLSLQRFAIRKLLFSLFK